MTAIRKRILIVDDDAAIRTQLKWAFSEYDIIEAKDGLEALDCVAGHEPDLVLLDLGLPPHAHEPVEGLATLEQIKIRRPSTRVVVITGQDERSIAREAIAHGACDFFSKPPDLEQVRLVVARALSLAELEGEYEKGALASATGSVPGLVARSKNMSGVIATMTTLAATDLSIMFVGEPGTGKQFLARALHQLSARKHSPFVVNDCASIGPEELDQALWPVSQRPRPAQGLIGMIQKADGGSILFRDASAFPPETLSVLLRHLESNKDARRKPADTNCPNTRILWTMNAAPLPAHSMIHGNAEWYTRLVQRIIHVPPLRERRDDLPALAREILRLENRSLGGRRKSIGQAAIASLLEHDWPENIRELHNRLRRALMTSRSDILTPGDFDLPEPGASSASLPSLREQRQKTDRELIQRALLETNGKVARAARMLGISRPTLYELIRTLDIAMPTQ